MKFTSIAVLAGMLLQPSLALADTLDFPVDTNSARNTATIDVTGDGNLLSITQDYDGIGLGNTLSLTVTGDLNGGPDGAAFTGPALDVGLLPGTILQSGHQNSITGGVNGTGNLFAFAQIGSGNSLTATIAGNYNQAAVFQQGTGNIASFSQVGTGNIVRIVQRSR